MTAARDSLASNGITPTPPAEAITAMQDRLIMTGEWSRMLRQLQKSLNESGWMDQLRIRARETAQAREGMPLSSLVQDITPYAKNTVPQDIKDEVTDKLRAWLDAVRSFLNSSLRSVQSSAQNVE